MSVELWLHPDKLSALQAALEREHSTLRDHLQSSLEELYRIWVPHEQRAELREKLREEFLQQEFPDVYKRQGSWPPAGGSPRSTSPPSLCPEPDIENPPNGAIRKDGPTTFLEVL